MATTPTPDERGALESVVDAVKPRLRGWLHAGMVPLTVVAGIVLIALAPSTPARIAAAVFSVTAWLLFGTSAVYHRGNWSPRVAGILKRLDHSNIFLIIAGSYTPFALLLHGQDRVLLLTLAWGGATLGIAFRLLYPGAPRWLYTPIYIALGWAAVFFLDEFLRYAGAAVVVLIALGGLLYTLGGIVYGLRRPNPIPHLFGFHEVFHGLTVIAFAAHYAGVSIATYSLR